MRIIENKIKYKPKNCLLCGINEKGLKETEAIMAFQKITKKDKIKSKFLCLNCALMIGENARNIYKMINSSLPQNSNQENEMEKPITESDNETELKEKEHITPQKIYDYISKYVISQETAKRAVSVAVYKHFQRINNPEKNLGKTNILITGPSGTGKTEIARRVSEYLDLPYVIADVTGITEAGFKGNDVEEILLQLVHKAGNIERAEKGIVFLDEIDKLAKTGHSGDISHEGVQQSLLKMIEGSEVVIPIKPAPGVEKKIKINTNNILFIASGAFSELEENKTFQKNIIGFNSQETEEKKQTKVDQEQLIKYGMLPEFIGRFPVITSTTKLDKEDLMNILKNTENSVLKEYQTMMEMEGFSLQFTDDSLKNIIDETEKLKTGARGLRTTVSNLLDEVMFEIPSQKKKGIIKIENGIAKIKINESKEREEK